MSWILTATPSGNVAPLSATHDCGNANADEYDVELEVELDAEKAREFEQWCREHATELGLDDD